jgi:hypothetical protein
MATPKKKLEDLQKVGRKTLYKPEYCKQVVDWMSKGFTMTAAAGKMGFYYDLFVDWQNRHPEFRQAINRGRAARLAKLEDELMHYGANKDMGKVTARIFALKCAQTTEWRERVEDQPVNVNVGEIKIKIVDPKR